MGSFENSFEKTLDLQGYRASYNRNKRIEGCDTLQNRSSPLLFQANLH